MNARVYATLVMCFVSLAGQGTSRAEGVPCVGDGGAISTVIVLEHDPVVLDIVKAGPDERQVGDLRILQPTFLREVSTRAMVGRLDATLLTTTVHYPTWGDEVRMSTLNFVFGEGDSQLSGAADQVLVSGSGYYPGAESTISTGTMLYRPVVGGAGRYAGVTGQAKTEHLGDGSWRHTLELRLPPRRMDRCR